MSGTSADGIDVALVRIQGRPPALRFALVHHYSVAYPAALRRAVLAAMASSKASVPDLARLNVRLSLAYADAVNAACKEGGIERVDLIGCHGQTIYHQGFAALVERACDRVLKLKARNKKELGRIPNAPTEKTIAKLRAGIEALRKEVVRDLPL